ncbi:MAG: benzoate-CoA ligase family protein [Actinobacteria bacterium]|nr:benzoate-CoA ligase family protein [Actinomycetota bacterium]
MQTGPNVSTLIDGWLEAGRGSDTALITADDEAWSADKLHAAVCNVAARLTDAGIRREDRLMLVLDDTPAFPAVFLGAIRIGAIPVPVNFLARPDDFGYFLDDSYAIAAVVDHVFLESVGPQIASRPDVRLIVANGSAPDDATSLDEWMTSDVGDVSPVTTHPDDMAFWLYSSGSTGLPKGVVHRHADVAATCTAYAESVLGISQSDVVFSSTKMFHAYGLGNSLSFPLWTGATSVYLTGRPTPDRLLERIDSHRPSVLFTVPALYNAMLADPRFDKTDWSVVRIAVSAAEPLPPEIWRQFLNRTGLEILDGIGSTELLHIYCSNREDSVKPGTTGVPVDDYSLEIRDVDGELCETNEAGEMWVKGPSALSAYWHQLDRTRDKIRGDWFLSGDRYRKDADGFYTYMGRVDDMMKVGGLWVSPIEIENRLMEHEAIQEAAVVVVEIDHRSRIKATVILTEGHEAGEDLTSELQKWCKAALQRHEFPHVVEVVEDFPRTATGKIQRFRLRD